MPVGIAGTGHSGVEGLAVIPSGVRVWVAMGHTDMRRGMQSLALLVQQHLHRDPFGGDLYVFRGRSGSLVKIIWHDGVGMSLYAKRLEKGRFIWPSATDGVVSLTSPQLACLFGRDRLAQPALFVAPDKRRIGGSSFSSRTPHFSLQSRGFL